MAIQRYTLQNINLLNKHRHTSLKLLSKSLNIFPHSSFKHVNQERERERRIIIPCQKSFDRPDISPVSNKLLHVSVLSNELRDRSESFIVVNFPPLRWKHSGPLIRIWRGWVHLSGKVRRLEPYSRANTWFQSARTASPSTPGSAFICG